MASRPSAFGQYLDGVGAREVPSLVLPEERAPDLSTVSSSRSADLVCTLELPSLGLHTSLRDNRIFGFFIDGVQRTVMLRVLDVKLGGSTAVQVPVHGVHLVAGAMRWCGSVLQPHLVRSAKVLLLPLYALREVDPVRFAEPPGIELDPDVNGFVYPTLISSGNLFSDTSVPLERGRRGRLSGPDLLRAGELRARAVSRAKVLLRIMELGVLEEVRRKSDENVLADGPIGPMFKYYGSIVSEGIADVASLDKAKTAVTSFRFLSGVVGAVKNVIIIPQEGLDVVLDSNCARVPVFRFSEVLREDGSGIVDDEVYKAVLCAFIRLRPEVPGLWSPIAGLTRLDIPAPVVIDKNQRSLERWIEQVVDAEGPISLLPSEVDKLRGVVEDYLALRWPLPGSFGIRTYTELYAIAETERWLYNQLLHPYELRRQLTI